MKKTNLYSAVAVAALTVAFAGNAKAEINPINGNDLFFVSGHAEAGIYKNEYWNNETEVMQNTRDDVQFNQGVIAVGKKLDKARTFDVGGRIDYMFGTDARMVQSDGLERNSKTKNGERGWGTGDYFSAVSQAYIEAGYDMFTLKVGKMLNPMGHESIYSPDRFFYSLSGGFTYRPATVSGAIVNWDSSCGNYNVYAGYISAMDQTFDSGDNNGIIAGFGVKLTDQLGVKAGAIYEKHDQTDPNQHNTSANLVVDYEISSRLNYTFEVTYAQNKTTIVGLKARTYSYNNELVYELTGDWALGGRFEYTHEYENVTKDSVDMYSFVLGANYNPSELDWLTIKPEVRYDRYGGERMFVDGNGKKDQISAGVSAMVKF
ncbi:MAG: porin [Lactobacillaceae bacterium]|jgi:hypothetical protein|nr:porin [Lactobacillaceae bacterium]